MRQHRLSMSSVSQLGVAQQSVAVGLLKKHISNFCQPFSIHVCCPTPLAIGKCKRNSQLQQRVTFPVAVNQERWRSTSATAMVTRGVIRNCDPSSIVQSQPAQQSVAFTGRDWSGLPRRPVFCARCAEFDKTSSVSSSQSDVMLGAAGKGISPVLLLAQSSRAFCIQWIEDSKKKQACFGFFCNRRRQFFLNMLARTRSAAESHSAPNTECNPMQN